MLGVGAFDTDHPGLAIGVGASDIDHPGLAMAGLRGKPGGLENLGEFNR